MPSPIFKLFKYLAGSLDDIAKNIPRNWKVTKLNLAGMGDDLAAMGTDLTPAAKSIALWGGGTAAAAYGIQQFVGMDEQTQEAEFEKWLAQNSRDTIKTTFTQQYPQMGEAEIDSLIDDALGQMQSNQYRETYQNLVAPFSEPFQLTTSMLWLDTPRLSPERRWHTYRSVGTQTPKNPPAPKNPPGYQVNNDQE